MKLLSATICAIMCLNNAAFAAPSQQGDANSIMQRYQSIDNMSKEEIQTGLVELSGALALLKNDLADAKDVEDKRGIAVKTRNVSLGVAATALATFAVTKTFFYRPNQGAVSGLGAGLVLIGSSLVIAGSVVTAVGSQAYVLLTTEEAAEIQTKIAHIEKIIQSIQKKLG